jgi:hypothetical protein
VAPKAEPELLAHRSLTAMSERFGDETVVLEPSSDRYVRLNANGSRLWERLKTPLSVAELAAMLAGEWRLEPERAHADVLAFVDFLVERGLIELRPRSSSGG